MFFTKKEGRKINHITLSQLPANVSSSLGYSLHVLEDTIMIANCGTDKGFICFLLEKILMPPMVPMCGPDGK